MGSINKDYWEIIDDVIFPTTRMITRVHHIEGTGILYNVLHIHSEETSSSTQFVPISFIK